MLNKCSMLLEASSARTGMALGFQPLQDGDKALLGRGRKTAPGALSVDVGDDG